MRRPFLLAALAAFSCCLLASSATAATNEIRLCGGSHGWEVTAGNHPPKIPATQCSFARATDRAVKELKRARGDLPARFELTVSGQALACTAKDSADYAEVRCKNPRRFVLIYKFK